MTSPEVVSSRVIIVGTDPSKIALSISLCNVEKFRAAEPPEPLTPATSGNPCDPIRFRENDHLAALWPSPTCGLTWSLATNSSQHSFKSANLVLEKRKKKRNSMPTCDILATQALQGAMQGSCIPTKPLLAMEPGVGIEPTTYALQVRCSTTELTRRGSTA